MQKCVWRDETKPVAAVTRPSVGNTLSLEEATCLNRQVIPTWLQLL